jgi:hypothetical protein
MTNLDNSLDAIEMLYELTNSQRDGELPNGMIIERDVPHSFGPTGGNKVCAYRTIEYAGQRYLVQVTKIHP